MIEVNVKYRFIVIINMMNFWVIFNSFFCLKMMNMIFVIMICMGYR